MRSISYSKLACLGQPAVCQDEAVREQESYSRLDPKEEAGPPVHLHLRKEDEGNSQVLPKASQTSLLRHAPWPQQVQVETPSNQKEDEGFLHEALQRLQVHDDP